MIWVNKELKIAVTEKNLILPSLKLNYCNLTNVIIQETAKSNSITYTITSDERGKETFEFERFTIHNQIDHL